MATSQIADALDRQLGPFIEQMLALLRIPGMAVGVVAEGATVYARGFGVASLADRRPVTAETLFHMASVTKPFVATAIMQLAEERLVGLDDPVVRHLPYFRMADERSAQITIRQMLSHTSGMPDEDDYGWERPEFDEGALERYVRSLADRPLLGAPGERFAYSNIAYEVLGDLIAKVRGISFEAAIAERILRPLRMTQSTLLVRDADPSLLSRGHVVDAGGEARVSAVFPYHRAHAPSSTLYSNVTEMCRWAMALLNGGELSGARVLSRESLERMWEPGLVVDPERHERIGLSWFIDAYRGRRTINHGGSDTGFRSQLFLVPEAGLAAVAMSNVDYVFEAQWSATMAALEIALGPSGDRS
ncbi:MAG TPA: serine hydrolase domain-containing protein [Thermomicrobiales bacterium]|nr:serine hydrolase domain-containing protein [Thermomicrobiales bacterium]